MKKHSAGLLIYRRIPYGLEVFLAHPGGPFYEDRDDCWGIPKGEFDPRSEKAIDAALREFQEETSVDPGTPRVYELPVQVGKHKDIHSFATCLYWLPMESARRLHFLEKLVCNTCDIEWAGRIITIPEVDKYNWFSLDEAKKHLTARQQPLLALLREAWEADNLETLEGKTL
jgi:predicted NUDIX family NTP pyrophosphohydrolase